MLKIQKHTNIIKIYDILEKVVVKSNKNKKKIFKNAIVMELGVVDLFTLIKSRKKLSQPTARFYFK